MRLASVLTAAALLNVINASPLHNDIAPVRRALSNSPSGGYAPKSGSCPTTPLIRNAADISDGEKEFLTKRHEVTDAALEGLLTRANLSDFDVEEFLTSYSPTIGLAFSGGGYRAMLVGAGEIKAMDSRTPGTTDAGQVGGLLQSATYLAGLSGGSWLLGSVFLNNFTTISNLQSSKNLWDLENSVLAPEGSLRVVSNAVYYKGLIDDVQEKEDAGFDVSLTDYWGRALSHQFLDWNDGGPGVTFSSIALTDGYKNADFPFPIVIADGRNPGEELVSLNATVFEFNPLEFGSFDPTVFAFTQTEYIGTNMSNGVPQKDNVCVRGMDNAGFVMGTSSSLFNQLLLQINSSGIEGAALEIASSVLTTFSESENDIADYTPNPFYGVNPTENPTAKTHNLTLVDGGEDLQNIPLQPLIQPVRKVDVIFAFDNSADTANADGTLTNWPNGTAIVASYQRAFDGPISNGTLFPYVPGQNTMVNLGLNKRATFFGCDGSNITAGHPNSPVPPLLVYVPNAPWVSNSNTTTMTLSYENDLRDSLIYNGYNIATQGNSTKSGSDEKWPTCVACAIIHREQERKGVAQSDQCKRCFTQHCWDGSLAPQAPKEDYNPTLMTPTASSKSGAGKLAGSGGAVVIAAAIVAAMAVL